MRQKWAAVAGSGGVAVLGAWAMDPGPHRTSTPTQTPAQLPQKAQDRLYRYWVERGAPGVSVAVSIRGREVWSSGVGVADVESLEPMRGDSVLRIASISKPITVAIAAKLAEEGKLDWDASIHKYLPSYPKTSYEGNPVTITSRQLASHIGGIRHYKKTVGEETGFAAQDEYYLRRKFATVTESLELFKDDALVAKPGKKFEYTTHGYTLLSAVLEKAAGQRIEELLGSLFDFLGMFHTRLDNYQAIVPEQAKYSS